MTRRKLSRKEIDRRLREAQKIAHRHPLRGKRLISEQLIQERRAEAKREQSTLQRS